MKKSTLKLALHGETLRVLVAVDLSRAVGGNPGAQLFDSGNAGTGCVNGKQLVKTHG